MNAQIETNEARQMILDSTDRLLGDQCTKALVDGVEEQRWPHELWQSLTELGLTSAMWPEQAGGIGLPACDALAVLQVAGRHALPVPLAEHMLAGWLLAEAGRAVPDGVIGLGVAFGGELSVNGNKITGTVYDVPWGRQASTLLLLTGSGAFLAPLADAEVSPASNMAGEPRDSFTFSGASADPLGLGGTTIQTAIYRLAATRVLLMAGGLEAALQMSVNYALERVQFGRSLAKFQAIQQQLAVLAGETATAVRAAAAVLDAMDTDGEAVAVAAAKTRAGDAVGVAAEIAHQVHGAMGFTHEHALHHRTRRLWAWRDEYGAESQWQVRLGEQILAAGADGVWDFISRH